MNRLLAWCKAMAGWALRRVTIDTACPKREPPAFAAHFRVTVAFDDRAETLAKLDDMKFWCQTRFGPGYDAAHPEAQWAWRDPDFLFADDGAAILFKMRWTSLVNPIVIRQTPAPPPGA